MQDHNWTLILGCSRQLLAAIQRSRPDAGLDPTASDSNRFYLSALRNEICGPADLVSFWFTRDVRTDDCNVPEDEVQVLLWLCYQERPWVRVAAMRLWRCYQDILLPRVRAFVACPQFNDEELLTFERAIEQLEEAIAVVTYHGEVSNDNATPATTALPDVNQQLNQVRYGGECFDVSADAALLMAKLVEHYPDWFSAKSTFSKPSEVKASLPEQLRALVETKSGKGYRLKKP